jgi:predicted RNA-binding Zn-ribbon protein involved in translation (DUF1610 family)
MKITVSIRGTVIIHYIDTLNVNTLPKDISSDKDALFKCPECGVALDSIIPSHKCHDSERLAYLLRTVPLELIQREC